MDSAKGNRAQLALLALEVKSEETKTPKNTGIDEFPTLYDVEKRDPSRQRPK